MGLADDFRQLSDEELTHLLHTRTELGDPPPTTFADLAQRASAPYSVDRCARTLDRFSVQLMDAVRFLGDTASVDQIQALAKEPPTTADVIAGLARLRRLGMVSRGSDGSGITFWKLPPAVQRVVGMSRPFGMGEPLERALDRHAASDLRVIAENLGVPLVPGKVGLVRLVADHLRNPARVAEVIRQVSPDAATRLRNAVDDGSLVTIAGLGQRGRVAADAAQLLSLGLLVPLDWDLAEVPREVALAIKGSKPLRAYDTEAPSVLMSVTPSAALELEQHPAVILEQVGRLLHRWAEEPPTMLKAGGLGLKDLRLLAKELGVDAPVAARVVALAAVAGLVSVDLLTARAVTTDHAQEWLEMDPAPRWVQLVDRWSRAPEEVGRVADEDTPAPALRGDMGPLPDAAWRRARVLRALTALEPGNGPDLDSLVSHVIWDGPGRWRDFDDHVGPRVRVQRVLGDAAVLGLTRGGALTAAAQALLRSDLGACKSAVEPMFPESVDTFTVQADLTAIAPGELRSDVGSELALLADVESRGGATLLRFSETSLRRAMDRGRTAPGIVAFLELHARPSVPQPLRYLVEDVGRRHGQIRVGTSVSYLRADDPALLAAVVNHRKVAKAGVRLISPNVAVSPMDATKLIKLVREAGFLPAPDGDGDVMGATVAERAPAFVRDLTRRAQADADRAWRSGLGEVDANSLPGPHLAAVVSRLRVRS